MSGKTNRRPNAHRNPEKVSPLLPSTLAGGEKVTRDASQKLECIRYVIDVRHHRRPEQAGLEGCQDPRRIGFDPSMTRRGGATLVLRKVLGAIVSSS